MSLRLENDQPEPVYCRWCDQDFAQDAFLRHECFEPECEHGLNLCALCGEGEEVEG